jgi:hypothetical protein
LTSAAVGFFSVQSCLPTAAIFAVTALAGLLVLALVKKPR